jgi:purine-binding chemotaxis protein CheW
MGRMSDARKRARRGSEPPPLSASDSQPAEESSVADGATRDDASPQWPAELMAAELSATPAATVASAEPLPPVLRAPLARPLELPSSGLAEDILGALEHSAELPPEPPPAPEAPAEAPAQPTRGRGLSFFGAPLREERQAVEATEHLVTFMLAEEEYGVDVRLVQEIIRVSSITPVPRAPEFIKGVINLRGRIIPVVDVKRKLGLGDVDEASRLARIVVVRLRDRLVGVLVDGASQVLRVPVSLIEAAPEEVVSISQSFIRGVAKLEKRLIILIALQDVLVPDLREAAGAGA